MPPIEPLLLIPFLHDIPARTLPDVSMFESTQFVFVSFFLVKESYTSSSNHQAFVLTFLFLDDAPGNSLAIISPFPSRLAIFQETIPSTSVTCSLNTFLEAPSPNFHQRGWGVGPRRPGMGICNYVPVPLIRIL